MAKRITKISSTKASLTWEEVLQGFLFWKQAQGISKTTYCDYRGHVRKEQPRIVELSEDNLRQLLVLPDQNTFSGLRDYALILLTLDTGIRPKEALSLTVNDLDLKRLCVTVSAEAAKTRTTRTLPILSPTAEVINKLINARPPCWGSGVHMTMTKRYVNLTGEDLEETHQLASPLNRLAPKKKERVRMVKI